MNFALLQEAAKKIEADGVEGLRAAESLVGMPTALAILIAHLRVHHGSMKSWPADPDIDARVAAELQQQFPAVAHYFGQPAAFFYTREWDCLDNFAAWQIEYQGFHWPTVEHAYQAAKYLGVDGVIAHEIRNAPSPHEAKKIAHISGNTLCMRPDWEEVKFPIMEELMRIKLRRHQYVSRVLRRSRGRMIVEDSHRDAEWGRGVDWTGRNGAGKLWMKIRDDPATIWYGDQPRR